MTAQPIVQRVAEVTGGLELHPNPVLNRVFATRGVSSADELDTSLQHLLPPSTLGDIGKATSRLTQALELGQTITVVGDFDADGATSTALAVSALAAMGAKRVEFLIPKRQNEGYGLSPALVDRAAALNTSLILTVDNGIAAHQGVARARELDIDVIVTDHHLPGKVLPDAIATVNPNVPGDAFESKHLAGVGVTFYVMVALRRELCDKGWFKARSIVVPRLADWLDLVAIGTIADLVPLDANNRRLVDQGIRRIRAGQCRPGISALLALGKRSQQSLVATDLGFSVAPRLNAAGRLDDMARGVNCLLAADHDSAMTLAGALDSLNRQRRSIESEMRESANLAVQKMLETGQDLPSGLSLHHPEWHPGVVGILAGRIKDQYHRPTVAFAATDHGMLVGSARSVPGLHIRDAIAEVANAQPDTVVRFGGHAMAAGLTIPAAQLGAFEQCFAAICSAHLGEASQVPVIYSDGALDPAHLTLDFARLIRFAAPWGQGFAEPQFDNEFIFKQSRVVGKRHLRLELAASEHGERIAAIAFGQAGAHGVVRARIVYRLDINNWRGRDSVQLNVSHIQPLA